MGNPISYTDPLGLLNIVGQVGGSFAIGSGVEGWVGVYITLPTGGNSFDIGVFASGGFAFGYNVGLGSGVGYVQGNESDIEGITYNANAGGSVATGTAMLDGDANLVGVTVGPAADVGGSLTYARTGAAGLQDILKKTRKHRKHHKSCP